MSCVFGVAAALRLTPGLGNRGVVRSATRH